MINRWEVLLYFDFMNINNYNDNFEKHPNVVKIRLCQDCDSVVGRVCNLSYGELLKPQTIKTRMI